MENKIAKKRIHFIDDYIEGSLPALDVTEGIAIEIVNREINRDNTISLLSDTGDTWTIEVREYVESILEVTSLVGIFKVNKKTGHIYRYNHDSTSWNQTSSYLDEVSSINSAKEEQSI